MQLLGVSGMAAYLPAPFIKQANAADPNHFWVMVHAGGGWDPTSLCDPKGNALRNDGRGPVNQYQTEQIKSVGNIRYSPYPDSVTDPGIFDNFFTSYQSQLLVVNGIDHQTNSHSAGTRNAWSGSSDMGMPGFAALVAAVTARDLPMTFLSNGGYDFTDSLVSPTRASGSGAFQELAFPNRPNPNDSNQQFLDQNENSSLDIHKLIVDASNKRLNRQIEQELLPQRRTAMSQLFIARNGKNNLNTLVNKLPGQISGGMKGQAEIAVAAFASNMAVSANLVSGGFDTHGNHDNSHFPRLATLLDGVDHLMQEINRHGLADRVTVVIGSDFGRTPYYNNGNGKDHWNVTSLMMLGAGVQGDRVVGATDANFNALAINPESLEVDPNGVVLTPSHVHQNLRRLAGIEESNITKKYGLSNTFINLLG